MIYDVKKSGIKNLKGYIKTDLSASTPCLYESEELNTPITEDAGESSLANQKNLLSTLRTITAVLSTSLSKLHFSKPLLYEKLTLIVASNHGMTQQDAKVGSNPS